MTFSMYDGLIGLKIWVYNLKSQSAKEGTLRRVKQKSLSLDGSVIYEGIVLWSLLLKQIEKR